VKKRKKENSALCNIFQASLQRIYFWVLCCACVGDLSDLLPVLCPSLITALQLSVLPRTISAEPPSDDHNNIKQHKRRNVVTPKRRRIWKKYIFCSKRFPQQPLKYCTIWITLYNCRTLCTILLLCFEIGAYRMCGRKCFSYILTFGVFMKQLQMDLISATFQMRSRSSPGSIVSDYGLDDRGSIPDWGRGFFF
jgi:hypothetical protein